MARVLIIDDESNIRMMLRLALSHVGHAAETAPDGFEGLQRFGDGAGWDLVLLDQRMPGMEGMEVLREMRRRAPAACVLLMTAFGTVDLTTEALRAGAADFLRKPFTVETLRGAVQLALGAHRGARGDADSFVAVSPLAGLPFERANINGFQIAGVSESAAAVGPRTGEFEEPFVIRSAGGRERLCRVVVLADVVEQVKAYADREEMPGGKQFWRGLCGEALANYLWQNADFPEGDVLRVEDLPRSLRHWVDGILAAEGAATAAATVS